MPNMDGFQLAGDAEMYFAAGMDDYLLKPVGIAPLRDTLERWATDHEPLTASTSASASASASNAIAQPDVSTSPPPEFGARRTIPTRHPLHTETTT